MNLFGDADELKNLLGQHMDIQYFKATKPFAPSSITVIYQSEYLCEVFPTSANEYTGTSTQILSEISHAQIKQASDINKAVTGVRNSVSDILPSNTIDASIEEFQKSTSKQREQLRDEAYSLPIRMNPKSGIQVIRKILYRSQIKTNI